MLYSVVQHGVHIEAFGLGTAGVGFHAVRKVSLKGRWEAGHKKWWVWWEVHRLSNLGMVGKLACKTGGRWGVKTPATPLISEGTVSENVRY